MAYREPKIIIGCRECEKNQREIRSMTGSAPFPTTTNFKAHDLKKLFETGYTCPFCQDKLEFNNIMFRMCQKLMNGFAHIESHPNEARVIPEGASFGVPHNQLFHSVESVFELSNILVEEMEKHVFRDSAEDLALIHHGMNSFDTNKWLIIIEASNQPEPLLTDDPFWSTL